MHQNNKRLLFKKKNHLLFECLRIKTAHKCDHSETKSENNVKNGTPKLLIDFVSI